MMTLEPRPIAKPDAATILRLRAMAATSGLDFEAEIAPRLFSHPGELFVNDCYYVIRERVGPLWHLSIRHLAPISAHPWRDYQAIKDQLVGVENEGVELFPARGRIVDLADQYHIWVAADPTYRFPFGFGS